MPKKMDWSPIDILSKGHTHDSLQIKLIVARSKQEATGIIVVSVATIWTAETRHSSSCRCLIKKDAL
jgi:hypothetical protein